MVPSRPFEKGNRWKFQRLGVRHRSVAMSREDPKWRTAASPNCQAIATHRKQGNWVREKESNAGGWREGAPPAWEHLAADSDPASELNRRPEGTC